MLGLFRPIGLIAIAIDYWLEMSVLEVTLSEQHQVAIPEEILTTLNFKVGQKFDVVVKGNLISLVPKPSIASFRGIMKGANTEDVRDRNDRV